MVLKFQSNFGGSSFVSPVGSSWYDHGGSAFRQMVHRIWHWQWELKTRAWLSWRIFLWIIQARIHVILSTIFVFSFSLLSLLSLLGWVSHTFCLFSNFTLRYHVINTFVYHSSSSQCFKRKDERQTGGQLDLGSYNSLESIVSRESMTYRMYEPVLVLPFWTTGKIKFRVPFFCYCVYQHNGRNYVNALQSCTVTMVCMDAFVSFPMK